MNLINIYRALYPKTAEYTYSPSAPGTFSRIGHILSHKSSLGKLKNLKIISSIFSNHNAMRLEGKNYKEKNSKKQKHVAAKQHATKQPLDN